MSIIKNNHNPIHLQVKQILDPLESSGNKPFTVALSGGVDSTALLYLVAELYPKNSLRALYVDHGLRSPEELEQEITLITNHCNQLEVALTLEKIPAGAIHRDCLRYGWSIEEAARNFRHAIFADYIDRVGGYMLLAHTADDQVETQLQRFFQGSGPAGLCGIAQQRGFLVRPLLTLSKHQLQAYIAAKNIAWSEDSTNSEQRYLRNKVRHTLIPVLEEVFPGFRKSVLLGQDKMNRVIKTLDSGFLPLPVREGNNGSLSVNLQDFLTLSGWQRFQMLCVMWTHASSLGSGELSYQAVLPLLLEGVSDSGTLLVSNGRAWSWGKGELFLQKSVAPSLKKGYFSTIQEPSTPLFSGYMLEIKRGIPEQGALWLPPEVLDTPCVVRSYQSGDSISLVEGRKQVKELFNQWSVPKDMRWQIPLLVNSSGIVAIMGKFLGFVDRVSKHMLYKEQYAVIPVVRKE